MKDLIKKVSYFDSNGLDDAIEKAKKMSEEKMFARYIDHSFGNHGSYMRSYFLCELLAIGIFALQMMVLNNMFYGRWFLYGYEVLILYFNDDLHHMIETDANPLVMVRKACEVWILKLVHFFNRYFQSKQSAHTHATL